MDDDRLISDKDLRDDSEYQAKFEEAKEIIKANKDPEKVAEATEWISSMLSMSDGLIKMYQTQCDRFEKTLEFYSNVSHWQELVIMQPVQIGEDDFDWCPDLGDTARKELAYYIAKWKKFPQY